MVRAKVPSLTELTILLDEEPFPTCPKCGAVSGDDWSQCGGSCPMPGSPHYAGFEHRPSRIVFLVVEGDSRELPGREVEDWACDGGDAEIEAEGLSPLEDEVFGQLTQEQLDALTPGWHIIVGFSAHYSKSYEGEVDVDISFEEIRPATEAEVKEVSEYMEKKYGQAGGLSGDELGSDAAGGLVGEPGRDDEGVQE